MKIIEPSAELYGEINPDEILSKLEMCGKVSRQSKLGDAEFLWSHSFLDDSVYFVWTINFANTNFSYSSYASDSYRVRCIKK